MTESAWNAVREAVVAARKDYPGLTLEAREESHAHGKNVLIIYERGNPDNVVKRVELDK